MSLLKPNTITGLNVSHPLHANIKSFVEFGAADKELVSNTDVITSAPTITDPDLGICRAFSEEEQSPNVELPVVAGDTLVVIKRYTGEYINGGNSNLSYASKTGGDIFTFAERGFTNENLVASFRSSFGTAADRRMTPYSSSGFPQGVAEIVTVPVSFSIPYSITINDTVVQSGSGTEITETVFSSSPLNVPLMIGYGATASANVAAILLFDRQLTAQEITDINADPWALVDGVMSAQITATNSPQGGEVFQFSGSNYSAQPTGPMTFIQGTRTVSRAVTISSWNAADGSFTGVTDTALPGVPAAGASDTPALLYGEPVTISLPDPGA